MLLLLTLLLACDARVEETMAPCPVPAVEDLDRSDWIEVEELVELQEGAGVLVLDVRSAEEFDQGHIPGAAHIPSDLLPQRLSELAEWRRAPVYVYCHNLGHAALSANRLRGAGFTEVYQVRGGWAEWTARGYPTER